MLKWSQKEIEYLRSHLKFENCVRIGEALKKKPASIRWKAYKLGLKIPRHIPKHHWNSKHRHLREKVMTYFLSHSLEEARVKFKLTHSEIKSLFTCGYRDPKLKHLRKDKRRHDRWTHKETLVLLKYAGIQPRSFIAKKLKRDSAYGDSNHSIKERLSVLKIGSKHINGAPFRWMDYLFPGIQIEYIKTKAGPSNSTNNFYFRIVPWVILETFIDESTPEIIASSIRALSQFQKFIHGSSDPMEIAGRLFEQSRES